MRLLDLAVFVHQEIGAVAMQHAGTAAGDRCGVQCRMSAVARRLDAIDLDSRDRRGSGWNSPIALEPPPMQAISESGRRPSISCICTRVSLPMIDWKSRTIIG